MGSAQGDKYDATFIFIDMNPITDLKRLLKQNSDASDKVSKRRLGCKTNCQTYDTQTCD